jgi:hypothetical protein
MILTLRCTSWRVKQEHNDSGGKMLEMLKKEYYQVMTFKDHQCRIERGKTRKGISYIQKVKGSDPSKWQHEAPCCKACTKNYYDLS